MTQRCLKAVTRGLITLVALVVTLGGGALHAQSTGKVQGTITDEQDHPVAGAIVTVVGTSFTATTNSQGYYFIENIPPATISLSARFLGFRAVVRELVRISGGQTIDQNFKLERQPVTLTALEAKTEVASNPLVPRDAVTTKQFIDGDAAKKLPVDRIGQLLALQPGVSQVTTCATNSPCNPTISVRGGRVDQNITYIDGVPVAPGVHTGTGTAGGGSQVAGAPMLQIATNGFEEASITTGSSSASQAGAQAGVINISTRTGSNKFSGDVHFETGMLGGSTYGQGFNTFAGSLSGPITKHLTFFVSGEVDGNTSTNGGSHANLFPSYSRVGIDTSYTIAKGGAASTTAGAVDSVVIPVYQYAVTEGPCNQNASSSNPGIASNYGASCVSNQAYVAPSTSYLTSSKLNYSFGQGSRLALSYNFSGSQTVGSTNSAASGTPIGDGATAGNIQGSNLLTLNWTQTLIRQSTHQLTIDAFLSKQWSNNTAGELTAASQQSAQHNSPLGLIDQKLKFVYSKQQFPLDSTLIYNILFNRLNNRTGITDPNNTGQYGGVATFTANAVPDGVGSAAGGGGTSDVSNIGLGYTYENRLLGKVDIDFQADRYNRLKIGGDYTHYDEGNFTTNVAGVYLAHPVTYDMYGEDRLDLGDVVVQAGLRYDYYWSKIWRWNEFPVISTRPGFTADSLFCPVGTKASATAKCALVQDPSHNYLSPHVQVSFPVNESTNFRLSYGQNVQPPDFGVLLNNSLSDINTSGQNSRSRWGQDLDFGKTVSFEFGARHAFSEDMVLDVAVYNNDDVANPSYSFQHPINPINGQASTIYEAENTDFGNTRGIDVRLDRRLGAYFNGSLTYSYQDSKNTGTDPSAYLGFFEPLSGFAGDPPTAALATSSSRPHSLTALFNANLPADFNKGTILGAILHNTSFYVTARVATGTAYTRCDPSSSADDQTISGSSCASITALSSAFNGARLPTLKQFDLRLNRNFKVGRNQLSAYVDARNVFNFQNVIAVYAQTGTQTNAAAVEQRWATDSSVFRVFAAAIGTNTVLAPGANRADGAIVLPNTIAGCGKLVSGSSSIAPECFYYYRSEQRFGNGDHIYTLTEQRAASDSKNARVNSVYGSATSPFVTGARTIRFGLELSF